MVLILFNLVFLIMKNMSNIKRQLRDLENTSFGPVTDKHYSISESNVKSRHNSMSNISPSLSNAKLFPDKKYSFITFKTEKMKNEIEEIKKQFLSYNTPQDQNSSISKAKATKCTLLNDSYDNNDIPYYIVKRKRSLFWRFKRPNKAEKFFINKNNNCRNSNNYTQDKLINPSVFNHSNDREFNMFMKDMSIWKEKKIAEWKDINLF